MLRILLDEGLPLRSAAWLRQVGIDAIHATEIGLASASDTHILAAALADARVCFTLDHDFQAILAATGATAPSVVLLRLQHADYVETAQLIREVIHRFEHQLEAGAAVTATRRAMRTRSLPLRSKVR
jgi:predicted nuclease of predicted toxin-antitoxin system